MESGEQMTAELFVRSLVPDGNGTRLEAVLQELSDLARTDALDDYTVRVCGEFVPTAGSMADVDPAASILYTVDRLETWAETENADLLGFGERTMGSLVDEGRSVLSLPGMVLVEYRDGDVDHVTPHRRDGIVRTVEDRLCSLGRSQEQVASGQAVTTPPSN